MCNYLMCRRFGLSLAPPSEFEAGGLVTADSVCVLEGFVVVKTCVGPREVDLEFVAVHITDQANLDKTALCDLGCTLDFVRKHLVCRGLRVPCFDQHRRPVSCRVVVHSKVEIPPRCEFLVSSCVKEGELPSDVCVVDPTKSLFEKSDMRCCSLMNNLWDPLCPRCGRSVSYTNFPGHILECRRSE